MTTFETALNSDARGKPPFVLHGDNSQTYESEAFKALLNHHGVCLSFTAQTKRGNQVIESAFNVFKQKMCLETIDNSHIPQSQTRLLSLKTKLMKDLQVIFGQRVKNAYRDKTGRDIIFNSKYFEKVCNIDIVLKVMNAMNQRKHVHYSK